MYKFLLILVASFIVLTACKKEEELLTDTSANLSFSLDTLTFDTVFTEIGSATRRFTVHNRNSGKISIADIQLVQGNSSNFRFNIDGIPGPEVEDLEIRSGDSVIVFVEVTVDPNNQSSPLVIFDAMRFITNGNVQEVTLEAWGQDAYYYRPTQQPIGFPALSFLSEYSDYFPIGINMELPNDKPHVVFGYLVVDSLINLNIKAGTQIHFYDGAGFWAYRGSNLNVQGELGNEVVFRGYRLEDYYEELPGQWDRIILNESPTDHVLNYAIIENSYIGLSVEPFLLSGSQQVASNKLILSNSIVRNTEGIGILARNYNIEATNDLIVNSQNQLFGSLGGGTYRFIHSTLANYWSYGTRQEGSFYAANAFSVQLSESNTLEVIGDQEVYFGNCILYGPNEEELEADSIDGGSLDIVFENCVVKTTLTNQEVDWFANCILNPETPSGYFNPIFNNTGDEDFTLHDQSVAIDAGSSLITDTLTQDLIGNSRGSFPDIGCYEFK